MAKRRKEEKVLLTYEAKYTDEFGQPSELPQVIIALPGPDGDLARFRLADAAVVRVNLKYTGSSIPLEGVWESIQRALRKSLEDPARGSFPVEASIDQEVWVPLHPQGMKGIAETIEGFVKERS